MKLLLDTHILLWALSDAAQLPQKVRKLLENEENEIYYLNVDIFSNEGFCKTINKMNEIISGKNRKNTLDHQQSGWLSQ